MTLYQIQYFWTLFRYEHFTRAAEALYITPPALTTAIKKLEAELGQQLIDRSDNSFVLTRAGLIFLEGTNQVLNDLDCVQTKLNTLRAEKKEFNLGVERALCSEPFLNTIELFSTGNVNTNVWILQRVGASVRTIVQDNMANLGVVIRQPQQTPWLEYSEYDTREYCLFFPAGHPFGRCECISPAMLAHAPLQLLNLAGDLVWPLRSYFEPYGIELRESAVTNTHPESTKRIIGRNLGMAIMPIDMTDTRTDVEVRPFDPPLEIEYVFVKNRNTRLTVLEKDLVDFLLAHR